jgi:nucleoside-diphosphate kinase
MNTTLIILKPDCMKNGHVGHVLSRFEEAGFSIVASKLIQMDPSTLRDHYAHVADKPFYPEIEEFMSSCPVLVLVLRGDSIVEKVRLLLGPTDSSKAEKGTIRGDYGTDMMINVVHASDSDENAAIEIARFFNPDEVLG